MNSYFIMALKNLRQRKLRSALTALGIIISVMTIFLLISLSLGLKSAVSEQFKLLGTDKIFIQPRGQLAGPGTGGAVKLTKNDVSVIERVRGVADVTYWTGSSAVVEFKNQKRFFFVVGFPFDKSNLFTESGSYKADDGKILGKGDEGKIMIGSQYKSSHIFETQVTIRNSLKINGKLFPVQGILKPLGNPSDDRLIYMSSKDLQELFPVGERIDTIIVRIDSGENISSVAERIQKKLISSRHVTEKTRDFVILTPEELLAIFGTVLNVITVFLLGVAAISFIVGGINMANTMYTSVLERVKEIGVMKAVGARNRNIFSIIVTESGLIGFIGGLIGTLLGFIFGLGLEYLASNALGTTLLQVKTPLWLFVVSLVFATSAGIIFGALPAIRASKLRVVTALRYE